MRRGSCIVLKRGLVPTRDSGRDIVMEVWKENTATVTIAGLEVLLNLQFICISYYKTYSRCKHGYGLSGHPSGAVCTY